MISGRTPMYWPGSWRDASALRLLKGTAIDCLIVDDNNGALMEQARGLGIAVIKKQSPPADVVIVKGLTPGIRMSRSGGGDSAAAGPTGVPWVDSNGSKIRLAAAQHPGKSIWMEATPRVDASGGAYRIAMADAGARGGRWIVSLDDHLAAAISAQKPEAIETWNAIARAAAFFKTHAEWSNYTPQAVVGVVSDFTGKNEFLSGEVLNLIDRSNQQYRIVLKKALSPAALAGLKAVIYPDAGAPPPEVHNHILNFVQAGGMLITGADWGSGAPAHGDHPRYALRTLGKGTIATAKGEFNDPYMIASDSAVLISHRHQLLRYWNGGAISAQYAVSPDGRTGIVQTVFYATRGPSDASVKVMGRYRKARLWPLGQTLPADLPVQQQKDGVEVHLPAMDQYAALEFTA